MMKRNLLIVLAMFVLVASVARPAPAGVLHIVTQGGSDVDLVEPGEDANASLIAIMMDDGRVKGQWHDNLNGGRSGMPIINFHARIVCLDVFDNEAWVVGEITKPKAWRGFYAWQGLRDLGDSAIDLPDQITPWWGFIPPDGDPCIDPPSEWFFWADYSRGQVRIE